MSAPLFAWRRAVMDSDLRPALKHLALTMATYMDVRGGSCFPSAQTLADDTSMNVGSIHRLREELAASGWLRRTRKGGSEKGGKRDTSAYVIARPRAEDDQSRPRAEDEESAATPRAPSTTPRAPSPRPRAE